MTSPSKFKAASVTALPAAIETQVTEAHRQNHSIVLVTAVFDVLHQEHVRFLEKASQAGDVLIVGIESDVRVRASKGPDRPVNSENLRVENLMKLNITQNIFILPDAFSTPGERLTLLQHIRPTYLAVSSNSEHLDAKRELMAQVGGEVKIVHEFNPEISTTKILAEQDKK